MICQPCRKQEHLGCPELRRWVPGTFPQGATELLGGQWCDCHHGSPGPVVRAELDSSVPLALVAGTWTGLAR
jgi:hypothetical protein